MMAPDVEIEDGRASILISSEEGETEGKATSVALFKLIDVKISCLLANKMK